MSVYETSIAITYPVRFIFLVLSSKQKFNNAVCLHKIVNQVIYFSLSKLTRIFSDDTFKIVLVLEILDL